MKITSQVWRTNKAEKAADAAADEAPEEAAQFLLEQANKTVPLEEADLEHSGNVSHAKGEASVSYSSPYAVAQHERIQHHTGSGRRKWLELTTQEVAKEIGDKMAAIAKIKFSRFG